jgi:hypothetical protein
MLEELLSLLQKGVQLGDDFICSRCQRRSVPGGIEVFDLCLRREGGDEHLLCLAIFPGRKPHLRPWVELFCLPDKDDAIKSYYGSDLETSLLSLLSSALGPGDRIFVEYQEDCETARALALGVPPALTRLGYKLFLLGFTWFKDWYFSEGGREGSQKLQAEKPINSDARRAQMERLRSQARDLLLALAEVPRADGETGMCLDKAEDRATRLLAEEIC